MLVTCYMFVILKIILSLPSLTFPEIDLELFFVALINFPRKKSKVVFS